MVLMSMMFLMMTNGVHLNDDNDISDDDDIKMMRL